MKTVVLEPRLEMIVRAMGIARRRALARMFYRWAKQLFKFCDIMEHEGFTPSDSRPLPEDVLRIIDCAHDCH